MCFVTSLLKTAQKYSKKHTKQKDDNYKIVGFDKIFVV